MAEKERASRQVIVISLITAACLIGDSMLYIVLPICFAQAGLSSLWEVGIILSVNRLVRLPLNPMVGWLYRHISDRTGIFIATVLATITTFSYAFADGFAVWLLLRCLWGIAWTLLRLGGFYCILNVSSDDNRGYFMGLYNGLYRIGSLAGMLLGGIFADWLGFSVTCMLFGACTAVTIVLGFICVPRGNSGVPAGTQAEERSLTWLWKDGTVLWVMATGLVVALIYQGLYASTLSELIRIHFGSSVTLLGGVAVGAATLGGVLQAIRWGWEPWLAPGIGVLSDRRFGRRSMMVVSLAFGVVVFGLVALRLPLPLWLAVLIGIQLTGTSLTTIADSVASDTASVRGGRVFMMWYSFAVDLGAALGPILAYLLNDMWGMDTAYAGTAVLLLILAVKWYWSAPLLKPFVRPRTGTGSGSPREMTRLS